MPFSRPSVCSARNKPPDLTTCEVPFDLRISGNNIVVGWGWGWGGNSPLLDMWCRENNLDRITASRAKTVLILRHPTF